ncbi:MAG: PilZ domain-containing protein [Planctomycetota bacterium]
MIRSVKLDRDASQRAMDTATRTQAQVVLSGAAFAGTTVNGFLISGDEAALLIEVTGRLPVPIDSLIGAPCETQVFSEQRYIFSTTINSAPRWGKSRVLAISRPGVIAVIERRRFLRAMLAPSSRVDLQWPHGGVTHRHLAAMLNVSADGLACRVDELSAKAIETDSLLQASFDLPGRSEPFHLQATVMNKVPGSDGCTIIGLQFLQTPDIAGQLDALREALHESPGVRPTAEACV